MGYNSQWDYNPKPTRKEYKMLKEEVNPDLTWDGYLKLKDWERRNWNPKAEEATSGLLEYAGNHIFKFEECHKMGWEDNKPYPHFRQRIEGARGLVWLCTYCSYLCVVDGNRYDYDLNIPYVPPPKVKRYDADSRGIIQKLDSEETP